MAQEEERKRERRGGAERGRVFREARRVGEERRPEMERERER
jgi:hypothetical protein